jgi:hypothetical protein
MRHQVFCWTTLAVMAGLLAGSQLAAGEPNTLTDDERAAGWKLLFDGKTTDGWRNYNRDAITSGWQVEDGALVRAERGAGDIITLDKYGAFELVLEYKISPGGNSGVMFHVLEQKGSPPWHTGPEIQIQDNAGGHDAQKSGWLYQLYPADEDASKPAGEWNELRVLISPEKCATHMNGVKYNEYVKGSADWDQRVAKSKFQKFEGFGKATAGHICLQDHGNRVSFRNIKIRKLD